MHGYWINGPCMEFISMEKMNNRIAYSYEDMINTLHKLSEGLADRCWWTAVKKISRVVTVGVNTVLEPMRNALLITMISHERRRHPSWLFNTLLRSTTKNQRFTWRLGGASNAECVSISWHEIWHRCYMGGKRGMWRVTNMYLVDWCHPILHWLWCWQH